MGLRFVFLETNLESVLHIQGKEGCFWPDIRDLGQQHFSNPTNRNFWLCQNDFNRCVNQGLDKLEMGERKAWTREEDQALVEIITIKEVKKWSHISKLMENQYNIYGRSGKQCRQRWHNQLDPSIKNSQWTNEEQKILFQNHNVFGNKWARISQELQGRTDNCVKNYFYSTLRRAFRRLNQYIVMNKQKLGVKELKIVTMTKLVAAAEDKFINKLKLSDQIIQKSIDLKNRLLPFSKQLQNTKEDQEEIQMLIREILQFTKSYKRKKSKKPKIAEEGDDDVYNEEQISIKEDSDNEEIESSRYSTGKPAFEIKQQQPHQPHQNLFCVSRCQVIAQEQVIDQAKQHMGGLELIHRPDSKIIQEGGCLQMFKKGSNFSAWSGFMRLPSLKQKVSELQFSLNRMDSGIILDRSLHYGNAFGCDFQQLN